ncbi:NMDA receptor synaptonuclear signaling and neuronal migration factor isoform X1 [Strongylocentrotus purpuratus]|uniref:NMDA receptor synaptonuclear signaling and neuronal migration factor n=1 Tax=Strongylocentrotus purpuratus TaxID=7668 RepID=A0A7M7HP27_STRPU|nr:NMDA receptor synaptonuclear signaling and neuronal migration factor isoform X1 [Strongylocentrotus purpuratus]|eukprot:XP_011679106.1 PREDICTED: NMDA receptor synaptonuclear signaling and neuronal migration factor isoform X1 [Strongylocentrotus purpuratus]
MGSGASKKKPESTVQKKLRAAAAFSSAGKQAQERRELQETETETNGNETKTDTFITQPDREKENGGPVANDNEKVDSTLQNGVTTKDPEPEDDEVFDKVTKIQSVFRGYQDRRALQKQNEMAIKIQRQFRRHRSSILSESDVQEALRSSPQPVIPSVPDYEKTTVKKLTIEEQMKIRQDEMKQFHRVLSERKEHRRQRARAWRDTQGTDTKDKEFKFEIGKKTKQEFGNFQDEITELKWYAEQQLEITLCGGKEYVPPRILLISSKVPKAEVLEETKKEEGIIVIRYDFNNDTFDTLIDAIRVNLEAYKPGCMAQSLCLYAQGGPGYLYMLKKKVLTTAKLKKENEADQVRFWKELGKMMSRIHPEDTVIHIMGCNILGSESGLQLFDDLEDLMRPNFVRFESPLELSQEGAQMVSTYFSPAKYHLWKSSKYSKSELILPPSMK